MVALAACGKSNYVKATAGGHGGQGGRVGRVHTKAQALELAGALNLQVSDLPGFTVASERQHPSAREQGLERNLRACMGGRAGASALAEASSKTFEHRSRVFNVTVSSSVKIAATAAQASTELKVMRSERARGCLRSFVGQLLANETHGGTTAKIVSISKGTPSAPGTAGGFGWRIVGGFSANGLQVPFFIDLLGFDYRQADVTMFSIGLPAPFPASAESQLFSLLVQRAKTGGTGKPGRPVKPLTGPRQVQISL